ncbi:RNA binding protein-like protein Ligatin/Tma64 [Peziza echinospora]|nr:RNA binding protein-like protein Ligatin/Tma64 [Peziza echinospora]
MFKKKPQIKPYAPIRSSDRRKFAQQIIDELGLVPEGPQSEERDAKIVAVRNSLVPEILTSAKFTTKVGPNLDTVSGVVYTGSHPGEQNRPLWVKYDDVLLPTVYTLWHNPTILPVLYTHQPVLEKLFTGADLMTPGLIGPPFAEGAKKGKLVSINSIDNPTVPMAVGVAEIDVSGLSKAVGEKGKAVRILHWYGDEIWNLFGTGAKAPTELNVEGGAGEVPTADSEEQDKQGGVEEAVQGLTLEAPEHDSDTAEKGDQAHEDQAPERELTTKEIDDAFHSATLYGIHHYNTPKLQGTLAFPLTSSAFVSTLVHPFLPPASFFSSDLSMSTIHPSLTLKKSSWKNAAKFLKQLEKEGRIKIKTRTGQEVVVMDIDWADHAIGKDFVCPYKLPIPAPPSAGDSSSSSATAAGGSSSSTTSSSGPLKILELYKPTPKLFPLFTTPKTPSSTKDLYSASELSGILATYLDSETTSPPTNKRLVSITPQLAQAFPDITTDPSSGFLKRDVLADKFVKACSPYHLILRPGESYDRNAKSEHKPRSGAPPKITITLETRQGRKTITKVSGLEAYRIDPAAVAEELQRVCASSTSVTQLVGSSPKSPVMEVMVQGPQAKIVQKLLGDRGVPSKAVVLVDKTGKKK